MLVEQAFFNLPEILVGSRYPTQDYEGGVVAAFSMALLQELNGRNAQNPISHLIAERIYQIDRVKPGANGERYLYQKSPFKDGNDRARYLRADLHVSLGALRIGSEALARYGWRHSNWIEAKFFRDSWNAQSPVKPTNGGLLVADLIRLMALPPIEKPRCRPGAVQQATRCNGVTLVHNELCTGRYLLHLYQGQPLNYQAIRRNKTQNKPGGKREWLHALLTPGLQKFTTLDLVNEGDTFLNPVNPALTNVNCEGKVTNFILSPISSVTSQDAYFCVLSRIESFKLTMGQDSWEVSTDRIGIESATGAYYRIRNHVGNHIHAKEKVDDQTPTVTEINTEDEVQIDVEEAVVENDQNQPAPI